ncbi:MAG: hypothetical protein ACJAZH_001333 [Roseivirga sp.]|jgi:hypothetical protein
MEKSIENIWKDGFLKGEALVAPKVNDLYNRKSLHIIDKFMKLFKINIWAIIGFSTALFIWAYFINALLAGSIILVMMLYVSFTAYREMKALGNIDKGQNSLSYLSSFKTWIESSIERYGRMYRIVYPGLILCFYFGLWFSDIFIEIREIVAKNPSEMLWGVHIYSTIVILISAIIMSVFSKAIHRQDVQSVYGGILGKLNEALAEMKELQE